MACYDRTGVIGSIHSGAREYTVGKLSKTRSGKSAEEQEHILLAEHFIDNLPEKERKLVQNYIERFTDWLAEEEPYLYQQGFMDGVRVMNFLKIL